MIVFYDMDLPDDEGGGGGGSAATPKNYKPTSVQQRNDWNSFVDFAGKQQGVDFQKDPNAIPNLLTQYKKSNPNFSLTLDLLPNIQYEQNQIRTGDTFSSLKTDQLQQLRQGLSPNFINQSNLYQQRYPQVRSGNRDYGTDLESYVNKGTLPSAVTPIATSISTKANAPNTPRVAGVIPLPDYNDSKSRLDFAQSWTKKYGSLMQGRGDTPLRLNEIPEYANTTAKDMAITAAKKLGLNPALLHASAMEEGLGGHFADKNGDYQYERTGQSDKFPVNSSAVLGLDQVRDRIKEFQAKGYLPADFQKHYTNAKSHGKAYTDNDVDLDSVESGMALKAAYLKDNYNDIDSYAKQRGINLSPKARDFFALANYNGGTGTGHQMLNDYYNNGYLEGDKFLQTRPTSGKGLSAKSYGPTYDEKGKQTGDGVYTNVLRRVQMAEALKKEQLLGDN